MKLKRSLQGSETGADVRMVQRALNAAPARTSILVTGTYDTSTQRRMRAFRVTRSLNPGSHFNQESLDALWPHFDAYGRWRYRLYQPPKPKPSAPVLGPIMAGGNSVLNMRLTHETSGIRDYPAFDDGWIAGRHVIAPERLTVTEQSGSKGGDAFYARGVSGMRYWVGHILSSPATGRTFERGETMSTLPNLPSYEGGPHVHLGLNAQALGVSLRVTGYGPGPTVGEQLQSGLEL